MTDLIDELAEQHRALRVLMARCEHLLDAGDPDPAVLAREVANLRVAFGAHNEFEERVLRPALADRDIFSAARFEYTVAEHVAEHQALRARLDGGPTSALRDALATIRAHLEAEERYLIRWPAWCTPLEA